MEVGNKKKWFPVKENTNRKRKKNEWKKKNTDRTQTKLNVPHVRCNVKILPQYYEFKKNRAQTKTSREKFLDFQQRNSKLEKIHAFQKKNASRTGVVLIDRENKSPNILEN